MNDKCDELYLDDFIVCNEAHTEKAPSQDYWINFKQFLT